MGEFERFRAKNGLIRSASNRTKSSAGLSTADFENQAKSKIGRSDQKRPENRPSLSRGGLNRPILEQNRPTTPSRSGPAAPAAAQMSWLIRIPSLPPFIGMCITIIELFLKRQKIIYIRFRPYLFSHSSGTASVMLLIQSETSNEPACNAPLTSSSTPQPPTASCALPALCRQRAAAAAAALSR